MIEITKGLQIKLTREEFDFIQLPKNQLRIRIFLFPDEFIELASFCIKIAAALRSLIINDQSEFIDDSQLIFLDVAKSISFQDLSKWQYKSPSRTHVYQLPVTYAIVICKAFQSNVISHTGNAVLAKIFQALVNHGLQPNYLTIKTN